MLGIHTVWTGSDRKGVTKIHDMMAFEVLTMILSCLYWKKFQGPIKLYCDRPFINYIAKLGIQSIWDEIDILTLDQELSEDVNKDTFWAYCKMYVHTLQKEPFVSLDIDLFQNMPYDYTTHDVMFSHVETSDVQNGELPPHGVFYYPNYHEWDMFKDRFDKFPDINIDETAFNVSVLAVNNLDLIKDWMEVSESFMKNNIFDPQEITTHGREKILHTIHSSSLMTFAEQRLLAAVTKSKGYSWKSLIDLTYSGALQTWEEGNMNNPGITHLWGWKKQYKQPEFAKDRIQLTDSLLNMLKQDFSGAYNTFIIRDKLMDKLEA